MNHKNHSAIKLIIPEHELTITSARSGGPGGQHVNKTNSAIIIHWYIERSTVISPEQKERLFAKLSNRLNSEGALVVHSSQSRSQLYNKEDALKKLHAIVEKALFIPKKRVKTAIPHGIQEKRLYHKKQRSEIKKMRQNKRYE